MSLIGNIIWVIFGGWIIFLIYVLGGIFLCLTIVGIPFGLQAFKLGVFGLIPFGRQIVPKPNAYGVLATIMNVIWLLLFGWEIALTHIALAIFYAITIIGIPFAVQHIKLTALALLPFGKEIR